jgi:short-subunit dehydrogenase
MEVNVFGLARLMQLVLPHMRKQQSGKIVNITSTGGKITSPLGGWYHASKFAVEALSDSVRMEVKQFGIDVIVIEPGGVKSEWSDIAMKHLHDVSVGKAYAKMAERIIAFAEKLSPKNAAPEVIAQLIFKSITTGNPKTRYHAGYMAAAILFMKKVLTDKQFDSLMLSQLK